MNGREKVKGIRAKSLIIKLDGSHPAGPVSFLLVY